MQKTQNFDTVACETIDMDDLEADLFGFIPVNFIRDLIPEGRDHSFNKSGVAVAADRSRHRNR